MATVLNDRRWVPSRWNRAVANERPLNIGLLGCGAVGSEVARELLAREGAWDPLFRLAKVAVLHPDKERSVTLPKGVLTTGSLGIVKDPTIDIVIELIGGVEPALGLIRQAIAEGKSVVTANKELIAQRGSQLLDVARRCGVELRFEAAVGGAVPIVRTVTEALAGDRLRSFLGIFNGTSNLILDLLAEGLTMEEAVTRAQGMGCAESDPSDDLSGRDAARKVAILASLGFDVPFRYDAVFTRGIEGLTHADLAVARELGFTIRLVGSAERTARGIELRVEPTAVPLEHPLASVRGTENLVSLDCDLAGRLSLAGPGAGGRQTAGAVLGDLVTLASGGSWAPALFSNSERVLEPKDMPRPFLVRISGGDEGAIRGACFGFGIEVRTATRVSLDGRRYLGFTTGTADESCVRRALASVPGVAATEATLIAS
ncbi:MAG: homoserine dehydrogenase [Actinomycetota bacterium]